MKTLDQYNSFKQTELGSLPVNWYIAKLEDLVFHIVDCLHEKKPDFIENGDKIYLEVFNIGQDGFLELSKVNHITDEVFTNWTKRLLPQYKDIVISKTGRVGAVAILPESENLCIGRNQVIIRSDTSKLLSEYLLLYLLSPIFQGELKRLTSIGTVLQSLHVKHISQIRVPLPSLKEQKVIVDIVYSLMLKKKLNELMNHTLESLAQSLFHSWFVRFDPFQDGEFVDSELGLIPKGWKVGKFHELAEHTKGDIVDGPFGSNLKSSDYTDEGVRLIHQQNISPYKFVDENRRYTSKEKAVELSRSQTLPGDIILTKMPKPIARATTVPNYIADEYLISADCIRIRPYENTTPKEFLLYLINSYYFRRNAEMIASGSTRLRINLTQIKNIKVIIPPTDIIVRFSKSLMPLEGRREHNFKENFLLSSLRDLLLLQLLSGNTQVKNIERLSMEIKESEIDGRKNID